MTSAFGLILKSAQSTGRNPIAVGCLNYMAAAILAGLFLATDRGWRPDSVTVIIGMVTGVCYVVAFWFLVKVLLRGGVAITMALVRLSVLIPILCSIIIWYERPSLEQTAGILFVCMALPLLGVGLSRSESPGAPVRGVNGLIGLLFLTTGLCNLSPKVFIEMSSPEQTPVYLFSLYGTAAVMSVAYMGFARVKIHHREYGHGILQGVCNIAGTMGMALTLEYLPGTLVFPVTSSAGLLMTTIAAILIWKERLRRPAYWGIGLTLIALTLVNAK